MESSVQSDSNSDLSQQWLCFGMPVFECVSFYFMV